MIYDNVLALCQQRKIRVARLEREAGLANGTVRGWKRYGPKYESVKKVADYFGVTIDALVTAQEDGGK